MGTQQLLTIVIGVITVGIGVAVGIGLFQNNAQNANADSVIADCMRISAGAQTWYQKPIHLGGGGNSFIGLTLQRAGFRSEQNENGMFLIRNTNDQSAEVLGTGRMDVTVLMTVFRDSVTAPAVTYN